MKPIIKIENFSFSYDNVNKQLNNVSLDINKGECVLVTGESGCGKTTLTRVLNGLVPYYYEGMIEGNIHIDGKSIQDMESWEYGLITGSVFQDTRSQFFTSNVIDELSFASENYSQTKEIIISQIKKVATSNKIEYLLNNKLDKLSSGEKQKVATSAVQVGNPEIYLLDEPSANLDYNACNVLATTIKQLKSEGKTIIIADHRIAYLMDVIDRVIYMKDGKIVDQYTVNEFKALSDKQVEDLGIRDRMIIKNNQKCSQIIDGSSLLNIRDLSVGYKKSLIKDINLSLKQGETIVLTGSNGIGKTTLAKTLCGLMKEKSGYIEFNRKKLSVKDRRKVFWFVLQDTDYQLFSESVLNELLLGHKKTVENIQHAEMILDMLNLSSFKEKHPATLSGGQKQRLTFAVGLMRLPNVLILDEPTSGLDAVNMKRIKDMIFEYAAKGISFIVISHDNEFIRSLGCRVIELSGVM